MQGLRKPALLAIIAGLTALAAVTTASAGPLVPITGLDGQAVERLGISVPLPPPSIVWMP